MDCDDAVVGYTDSSGKEHSGYCAVGGAGEGTNFCGCVDDVRNADPEFKAVAQCIGLVCSNGDRNAYKVKRWGQDDSCTVTQCTQNLINQGSNVRMNIEMSSNCKQLNPDFEPNTGPEELTTPQIAGIVIGVLLFILVLVTIIIIAIRMRMQKNTFRRA
jgi:hypothetical protein